MKHIRNLIFSSLINLQCQMMPLEPKKQNVLRLHLLAAPMMISFIVHGILLLLLMSTHFDNLVIRDS